MATADRILDEAERLFAERGIDSVSLYEIASAAEIEDPSDVQTFVGDRDTVLRAVMARRMGAVDARRQELMDELDAEGTLHTPRGISEAIVFPLAEQLAVEGGRSYLRILAELSDWDPIRALSIIDVASNSSLMRSGEIIDSVTVGFPGRIRGLRRQLLMRVVFRSLADQARWELSTIDDALFVGNLIDMAESALVAPVSDGTRSLLDP